MTGMSPPQKITPMFAQYLAIKAEHPDALLFYRMGDFYELFFEDARTAARELQITLTSRNPANENPVPMCGVPHHAAENYLATLLEKGYKVAVCDQMEDPKTAKGLVKRGVTRVLTPGTVVEDSSLDAKGHKYLGAVYQGEARDGGAFAWVDYSTGEWSGLFSKRIVDLWQWVLKLAPRELLLPDYAEEDYGNIQDAENSVISEIDSTDSIDFGEEDYGEETTPEPNYYGDLPEQAEQIETAVMSSKSIIARAINENLPLFQDEFGFDVGGFNM